MLEIVYLWCILLIYNRIDPVEEDVNLWMPDDENPPRALELLQAIYILDEVGDQFCDLISYETNAIAEHMGESKGFFFGLTIRKSVYSFLRLCRGRCCLEACSTRRP